MLIRPHDGERMRRGTTIVLAVLLVVIVGALLLQLGMVT